jgi:pimeloyl-ACP methyl ester carboxylesterase
MASLEIVSQLLKGALMKFLIFLLAALSPILAASALTVQVDTLGNTLYLTPKHAAKIIAPMRVFEDSAGIYAVTPKQKGEPKPLDGFKEDGGKILFNFIVPKAGTYTLFAKTYWLDGGSNSFWVKIDSGRYERLGNGDEFNTWVETEGPVFELPAGDHTLTVREREGGAMIQSVLLVPVDYYISRRVRSTDSVLISDSQRIFLSPPYALGDSVTDMRLFLADTGSSGILMAKKDYPLTVKTGTGKLLYQGRQPAGCKITLHFPGGIKGDMAIDFGKTKARWSNFMPRLSNIDNILAKVQRRSEPMLRECVRPSLMLHRENILRGYQSMHRDDLSYPLASFGYVDSQLAIAEEMSRKALAGKFDPLENEGWREYAYFSEIDSVLCPYTVFLPKGYRARPSASPAVLFLHGMNGTQWALESNAQLYQQDLSELKLPVICPYYRGNPGVSDTIQHDLHQLIRLAGRFLKVDTARVALSGFSMGGFLTCAMAYMSPTSFIAFIPIGGGIPDLFRDMAGKPRNFPPPLKGRFIIMHSPSDETVPFALGKEVEQLAARLGPWFISYPGGHELPSNLFSVFNEFAK